MNAGNFIDLDEAEARGGSYGSRSRTNGPGTEEPARRPVKATPFVWVPPAALPQRRFLYGGHYVRRFISTTVAPGGVGKSSLGIVEALAIATGRDLLGVRPDEQTNVWLWNGEDPLDELQRRVTAAAVYCPTLKGEVG
jgi:hypothetical protein